MALRRFWRFEDGEGGFGARLLQLRTALQNESLDFQMIRAALSGGELSISLEAEKTANTSPANDKAGFDHSLAQQLVVGLKGISYFNQPSLSADSPIAATPDTLSDWSRDRPELTNGNSDQLVLGGGIVEGSLGEVAARHEHILYFFGSDYTLIATDADVSAADVVAVIGSQLGGTNGLDFDGSAERDGSFLMLGGAGDDRLAGGSGDDSFDGGLGGDWLSGGAGADTFHYSGAADSTGARHDTLSGFDFRADKIDLPTAVTGFDAAVVAGALSQASFDADLATVLGAGKLGAGRAAWFTPNGGDLAGRTFLVVDGNGVAGYQAGEDYVFHMAEPQPVDLSGVGFFV